jgi:hypothetical protein
MYNWSIKSKYNLVRRLDIVEYLKVLEIIGDFYFCPESDHSIIPKRDVHKKEDYMMFLEYGNDYGNLDGLSI